MIRFLFKGLIRDRSRSLLPVIVVSIGVMVTVFMHCWMKGIMGESVENNANFINGHLKVMTRAYAKESAQLPNDLALMNTGKLITQLKMSYPQLHWSPRIRFGALVDVPDGNGETRAQGPVTGWALDLLSGSSDEAKRFRIAAALQSGDLIRHPGEALLSSELAKKFNLHTGDLFTLFGTSMEGSMSLKNFKLAGTVNFGVHAIDRGAIICDVKDAQAALMMDDAAGEVLGFFKDDSYHDAQAIEISEKFNSGFSAEQDEYAPLMIPLSGEEGMYDLLTLANTFSSILIFVFVLAMSVVLWNAGLIGSLRRFSEFGVRLALGEDKHRIFISLIQEGLLVGFMGTVCGSALGLGVSYYVQTHGFDLSGMMKNSSMMMPAVVHTVVTPTAYVIGFIPGMISMLVGNALAGMRIYQRKTATLFKELEN